MILIVDDRPENIYSLKFLLESKKFNVDTALSGQEALKKVLKREYALIILDVQMPGMDGFEVAEALSGYSKTKEIPIIFLSAMNTEKKFITKGYDSGGIDYITKPVDPDILLLKVKTFYRLYEQNLALKLLESKKDEFMTIASHELKTPLTSIKAYIQLLERLLSRSADKNVTEYIHRAHEQVLKLEKLISELLDISKIENGKLKMNKKHFDLEQMVQNTILTISNISREAGVSIVREGERFKNQVFADEIRVEQVLINFLTNAIKYSPGSGKVVVRTSQGANHFCIAVQDFGIGIPEEKQKHIFSKFYRVEESSVKFQGLGIGLYICAEIIRQHQGTYGITSTLGKGTTVHFSIPLN